MKDISKEVYEVSTKLIEEKDEFCKTAVSSRLSLIKSPTKQDRDDAVFNSMEVWTVTKLAEMELRLRKLESRTGTTIKAK